MNEQLTLYLHHGSVCCSKVQLVLEEKGLAADYVIIDHRAGETHTPAYLALNPRGVVPTLVDCGRPIIESTVICEYLDEAYPAPSLRPEDPFDRAKMRLWTMRPDAGIHMACAKITFAVRRDVDLSRQLTAARPASAIPLDDVAIHGLDAPNLERHFGLYDLTLAEMACQLNDSAWLGGERFSLADIAMLPYVMRLVHLGIDYMWRDHAERSSVSDWLAACQKRTSFGKVFNAFQLDFSIDGQRRSEMKSSIAALLKAYYST